jgi:hypothetical protein
MTINDRNSRKGLIGLGPIPKKAPVAAFNIDQIHDLLRTKGFLAFHCRHALNPKRNTLNAGMDLSEKGAERPFIFYDIRPILMVGQDFSVRDTLTAMGLYGTGTSMFSVAGEYLDGSQERVFIRINDVIILNPTMTELFEQNFEYKGEKETSLMYRARAVDYMLTARGTRLNEGLDFHITTEGKIQWVESTDKPKVGEIVSIVYYYQPIFIVRALPHNIRLLPSNNLGSGNMPRDIKYAPQLVLCDYSTVRDGPENSIDFFNLPELQNWEQFLIKPSK